MHLIATTTFVKTRVFLAAIMLLGTCAAIVRGDDVEEIKAILAKHGLSNAQATLVVEGDKEFAKQVESLTTPKRQLMLAMKELKALETQTSVGKNQLSSLRQEHVRQSALLTQATTVTQNNQVVGALNALQGQMQLLEEQLEQHEERVRKARGAANEAREKFIETLLTVRKSADKVNTDYAAREKEAEVTEVLDRMKGITGKTYTLGPTPQFRLALKKLQGMEDTVLSESIPLREDSNTHWVSVVVNGEHTQEMVVDSGASLISLPFKMAEKFGLSPGSKDEQIIVVLADGSQIRAWKMKLTKVRVGKFTVENVDCAVLGPEATAAEPLLGMSFLQNFQFEVDAANRALTMVKVSDDK